MCKNIMPDYVCIRCAQNSPTCCQLGADGQYNGEDCFPLSEKEYTRIAQAVEQAEQNPNSKDAAPLLQALSKAIDAPSGEKHWAGTEENSESFVQSICNLFPRNKKMVQAAFPLHAKHRRLALTAQGACVFLSAQGCTLPRDARPWFCRIFPFWVQGKAVQCFHDENCLAVQENSRDFMALLHSFDTSKEEVAELFKKLRNDWGLGN